jgi:hypothetical protein
MSQTPEIRGFAEIYDVKFCNIFGLDGSTNAGGREKIRWLGCLCESAQAS